MTRKLAVFAPQILGATRVLTGSLFFCHGAKQLLGAFGGPSPGTTVLAQWVGGPIQLVGGALLAVGVCANGAAFVASGMMAVAYFISHAPRGFWPIENGGELAILYCWLFLNLAAQGPGAFAVRRNTRGESAGMTDLERSAATIRG